MFGALINGLSRLIPSQCAVCRAWPAQPVCEDCVNQFAQPVSRCRTCALPLAVGSHRVQCGRCLVNPPVLDSALAAVSYAYPWSGVVVKFKFHGETAWARSMATLMRSAPWVEPALDAADWLIPMPLTSKRLKERGFNQTGLVAHALQTSKVRSDLLLRILDAPPQSSLPRTQRLQNVQGAYAVEPLKRHMIEDKRIVLMDDVMTSGASLYAAASALRQAGAAHITALVFARTES